MSTEQDHFEELSPAKIIGLTGGIASGKSTVSRRFHQLGVAIIDADLVAREVVAKGEPALKTIVEQFGEEVLLNNGELNRARVAKIIFSDAQAREQVNAIMRPYIARTFLEKQRQLSQDGHRWVIYDAALILENNLQALCQALIVVSCDPEIQMERLMARNQLSLKEAQMRLSAQFPLAQKIEAADWVIDNSASFEETGGQVDELFRKLCLLFGMPKAKNEHE